MDIMYGHDNFENAYEVDNYPWGFKLKTKRRYWIETKKGFGDRLVFATLNPKNGKWCKPKAGTYQPVQVLALNQDGHVITRGLGLWQTNEDIAKLLEIVDWKKLNEIQQKKLCEVRAVNQVMKKVEFKVEAVRHEPIILGQRTPEQQKLREQERARQEARKQKEKDDWKKINKAINNQYAVCLQQHKLLQEVKQ